MTDRELMERALALAARAAEAGEIPVGAVVAHEGRIIGEGFNRREAEHDPTAHAEVVALRAAGRTLGSWHLAETTLCVTLEPCPMCAGALVNARVARLVFGCTDPKAGAVETLYRIGDDPRLNHRMTVVGGVEADRCAAMLQDFFKRLREKGTVFSS